MTEETTTVENTEPANSGINITVEQILAALISTVGNTTIPLEKLITNYGDKSIAVNQNEDKSVTFSLVDLKQEEPTE